MGPGFLFTTCISPQPLSGFIWFFYMIFLLLYSLFSLKHSSIAGENVFLGKKIKVHRPGNATVSKTCWTPDRLRVTTFLCFKNEKECFMPRHRTHKTEYSGDVTKYDFLDYSICTMILQAAIFAEVLQNIW